MRLLDYDDGIYRLMVGDARTRLLELPAGSAQVCVTSPPYFGLRHYQPTSWDGGSSECDHAPAIDDAISAMRVRRRKGWSGGPINPHAESAIRAYRGTCPDCGATEKASAEVGRELTEEEYLGSLWAVFDAVAHVLRDDGVLWVNLGDSSAGSGKGPQGKAGMPGDQGRRQGFIGTGSPYIGHDKPKDQLGMPWKFAEGMKARGWYWRDTLIWLKDAPTPKSYKDRFTDSWEPVFQFTKSAHYYWDYFAAREPAIQGDGGFRNRRNILRPRPDPVDWDYCPACDGFYQGQGRKHIKRVLRDDGSSERLCPSCLAPMLSHTAAYPEDLPRELITPAVSEHGACAACLAPFARVTTRTAAEHNPASARERVAATGGAIGGGTVNSTLGVTAGVKLEHVGWAPTCDHFPENGSSTGPGVVSCTVLDPFSGSGTTALAARNLGLRAIGCELFPDYARASVHRVGHALRLL